MSTVDNAAPVPAGKKDNPNFVPFWERVAYGCGDIGTNFYLQSIATFLLLFYTDYLGIPAVIAGTIMLVSRIWDAVNDVIIGTLADRTGNYKRWIFWGALLSMFTYLIMYLIPPFGLAGKIIYALITFSIWTVTYTMLGVPINAMASTITPDAKERARLNGVRFPMITIPLLIAIAFTMPLVDLFGNLLGNEALGFPAVAFVYGLVGWLLVLICIKFVKERAPIVPKKKEDKISFKETLRVFKGNKPAVIAMLMFFLHFLSYYTSGAVFVYFSIYIIQDVAFLSYYAFIALPVAFVGMTFAPKIFLKTGVRFASVLSILIIAATHLVRAFFPTVAVVLTSAVIQSFFSGAMTVLCYTMIGDVVTYTKWKGGGQNVAIFYSSGIFSQKTAMALSAFFGGAFLSIFGYIPNQPQQTAAAQTGIILAYAIIPFIGELILAIIASRWPLDKHESLQYLKD